MLNNTVQKDSLIDKTVSHVKGKQLNTTGKVALTVSGAGALIFIGGLIVTAVHGLEDKKDKGEEK